MRITCVFMVAVLSALPLELVAQDRKAAKSADLKIPHAKSPTLDGKVGKAEWDAAVKIEEMGGTLQLQHDGKAVHLLVRLPATQVTSAFLSIGKKVFVLHASARLGTAIYEKTAKGHRLKQGFRYAKASPKFEARDGWLASDRGVIDNKDLEFRIPFEFLGWKDAGAARTHQVRFAFTTHAFTGRGGLRHPAGLDDSTVDSKLLVGHSPESLRFEPSKWRRLVPVERSEVPTKPKSKQNRR